MNKMTHKTIRAALDPLGRHKFDLTELARNRIKARAYPKGSLGFESYAELARNGAAQLARWDIRVTVRQFRAAYTLARAALA